MNRVTGKPATARPCWHCVAWCEWAGVKRIFYWDEAKDCFEVMRIAGGQCKEVVYRTRSDMKKQAKNISPE
jgi:tRNA(Arg) A34 adenosine deaminase TadA